MHELKAVAVGDIRFSKTNPRAGINQERLNELAESIRNVGVLEPILVRPVEGKNGSTYELVCGERRLRAAQLVKLEEIPAIVRVLTDQQALEVQVIENLQREDLHPLDEAEGYRQLMATAKYDVARIAARIGRSVKYVYDRVKLLALVAEAKKAFLEERITAGHAILLARLTPAAQKRALGEDDGGGVFQVERTLFDPKGNTEEQSLKARSVRELQAWIDEHVRFDVESPDLPDLFPETAAAIAVAADGKRKIIPITHEHYVQQDARDKERMFGPRSWKRADGNDWHDPTVQRKVKSKTCERSGLGVILAGPGRGDSFDVCVSRSCEVHWPQQAKKAAGKPAAAATAQDGWQKRQAEERRQREERSARWKKAMPEILKAIAAAIEKASPAANGPLAQILTTELSRYMSGWRSAAVPRGRSAEDLVRHLAFCVASSSAQNEWSQAHFLSKAKMLGLDVAKILKAEALADAKKLGSKAQSGSAAKKSSAKKKSARP